MGDTGLRLGMLPVSYDTPLPADKAAGYAAWRAALPTDLQNTSDYDLQGAYLAGAGTSANDHMTDQFKKPNHMTFSDQSQYSTPAAPGGTWGGTDASPLFWASPVNMMQHSLPALSAYMQNVEKGQVVAPIDYSLPPGGKK